MLVYPKILRAKISKKIPVTKAKTKTHSFFEKINKFKSIIKTSGTDVKTTSKKNATINKGQKNLLIIYFLLMIKTVVNFEKSTKLITSAF